MPKTTFASRFEKSPQLAALAVLALLTAVAAYAARPQPPESTPDADGGRPLLPAPDHQQPRIEVAFAVDTTGSMSGLLEGTKRKVWSIANQLASGQPRPEIRVALIAYRDRGDDYVTQTFDLTSDIDALYGHLYELRAAGGGDTPESVNRALHEAVTQLSWTPGSQVYKVIFLVGDAPPHMDYDDDVPFQRSVDAARAQHIVINTVQCGTLQTTTPVWQQIASAGGGQFAAIAQDGAMVALATPHDEELAALNRELAATVLPYGDASRKRAIARKLDRSLAAPAPVAASRLGFLSKAGGDATSGERDLVDAVKNGDADLADVHVTELPAEMQAMKPAARQRFVTEKLERRAALQGRVDALSAKRDAYVAAETERLAEEGMDDGFDQKVLKTIRAQAAAAGIAYE